MGQNIIKWNCHGLKANINELFLFITQEYPSVICFHETFLKPGDNINSKNYQLFNYIYDSGYRASGEVSVFIRNDTPHIIVNLKTNIEAVVIKATMHKVANICSIYSPPSNDIDENEVKKQFDQLPKPFILLEDFNSHNTRWGVKTQTKGQKSRKRSSLKLICAYLTMAHLHMSSHLAEIPRPLI